MAIKKFTKIADDAFEALQLEAGVLLNTFDPANPVAPQSEHIVATTTGGVNPVCQAEYQDFAEDVDNAPNNVMEFKQLTGWLCSLSFSTIKFNAQNTVFALGAADVEDGTGFKKITPRRDLNLSDFKDIWWVGDKANGGAFAIRLMNALSTEGLSIQTSKNGKGTNDVTLTGHVSLAAQDKMPMEFYDIDPDEGTTVYTVTQNLTNATSDYAETTIDEGEAATITLTADTGYTLDGATVTVMMNGVDVTGTTYVSTTGVITIAAATGNIVITATAVEE